MNICGSLSFQIPLYGKLFVIGGIHFSILRVNEDSVLEFFPSLTHNSCVMQSKNIWLVGWRLD